MEQHFRYISGKTAVKKEVVNEHVDRILEHILERSSKKLETKHTRMGRGVWNSMLLFCCTSGLLYIFCLRVITRINLRNKYGNL
jgi:hypothetical protein